MLTIQNPRRFDWKNISLVDCCEGNAMDSYFTLKLFNLICEKLDSKAMHILEDIFCEANSIFAEIEYEGLAVDRDKLKKVGKHLKDKNIDDNDSLYSFPQVKKTDNLSSTKDLIEILYTREDGFGVYPPDRTNKGAPSVSAPTLTILMDFVNEELNKR
jgi:DNA polymerase I-like protein with 3'-5' exonuclease and polymerase domains